MTAGNASGVNDGAAALIVASEAAAKQHGLTPRARIVGDGDGRRRAAHHGHRPGAGDAASCWRGSGSTLAEIDVIELNEAFAAQALAVLRELGLPDDAEHVNPNGGAIALGHPLGMSRRAAGRRTAVHELDATRRPLRAVHDVHRRRPGHRRADRARLTEAGFMQQHASVVSVRREGVVAVAVCHR